MKIGPISRFLLKWKTSKQLPFSYLPFPLSTSPVSTHPLLRFTLSPFPFPQITSGQANWEIGSTLHSPAAPLVLHVLTLHSPEHSWREEGKNLLTSFFFCLVFNNCFLSGHGFFILSCYVFYSMVVYSFDGVFNYSMFYSIFMFCLWIV